MLLERAELVASQQLAARIHRLTIPPQYAGLQWCNPFPFSAIWIGRAQASLDVLTMISNGSDSVLFVGPDGNLANALHLAVDKQGRILGGLIPISGTKILSVDASR